MWAVPVNKSGFMQLQSLSAPEIQIAVRKSHNTPTSPDECLFHLLCIYVFLTLYEKLLKWSRELPWGSLRPYHLVIDKCIYLKQKHKYRRLINVSSTLPSTSVFISILCMNETLTEDFTYKNCITSNDSIQLDRDPALRRALSLLPYSLSMTFFSDSKMKSDSERITLTFKCSVLQFSLCSWD